MILSFAKHFLFHFPQKMFTSLTRSTLCTFRPKQVSNFRHLSPSNPSFFFSSKQRTPSSLAKPLVLGWRSHLGLFQGGTGRGVVVGGVLFGLMLVCFSKDGSRGNSRSVALCDGGGSGGGGGHGKSVLKDYSITGIPGDGRCMFRSVAHGACLRSGKPSPNESLQKEMADDLRARVADEFVKRREETEWFIEGDFDTYISQIRKPHVWGGEPELFMASHVLQMPITVYMYDEDVGGLISIAEYGEEYGKDNPIRVLYHGFGHYDALDIKNTVHKSRL